ncbi:MAG: YicC family protein [Acidobacteria bacterium]|nr:YicC family protein [Acidobacteriota bacterium]
MARSMTGYGRCSTQTGERAVAVEVRTTNHRFLDLHVRLPREYGFLESRISQALRAALTRGRVDISVSIDAPSTAEMMLNPAVARSYVEAAEKLREQFGFSDRLELKSLLMLPGVVHSKNGFAARPAWDDTETAELVLETVAEALQGVVRMRDQEGAAVADEMRRYLLRIREQADAIRGMIPAALAEHHQKLRDRLSTLLPAAAVDPQRLAQEIAMLSEKTDIAEELIRLESHVGQGLALLDGDAAVGKELDFLVQEMHREVSTTLAKTSDMEITRLALGVKADVERFREQVQNVE